MALLLLVRMRTRSCVLSLWQSLVWKHEVSLQPLLSSLSSFCRATELLVQRSDCFLLLSLSCQLGARKELKASRESIVSGCVSMFQPFLSFQTAKKLFPRSIRLARSENGQDRGGGRAGRESFSCSSQSLPCPLYHPSSLNPSLSPRP